MAGSVYQLMIDMRANVASLQSDMTKAVGILESSKGRINQVMQGIFQGVGIAVGQFAIRAVGDLTRALGDLADAGDKAGAIADNFRKLGGSADAIQAARKAVLGTVDAFDLMQAANTGLAKGIPNLNANFAQLAEFANRFADATGQETLPVLNELINALATGAPKALKQFGFDLREGATAAQNTATAYDQLGTRMTALAPLGEGLTQGQQRLTAALSQAFKEVGLGIDNSDGLADSYNRLAGEVEKIDWMAVGDGLAYAATQVANLVSEVTAAIAPFAQMVANLENIARAATITKSLLDRAALATQESLNVRSPQQMLADAVGFDLFGSAGKREQWQSEQDRLAAERKKVENDLWSSLGSAFFANVTRGDIFSALTGSRPGAVMGAPNNFPRDPRAMGMEFQDGRWVQATPKGSGGGSSDAARRKKEEDDLQKKRLQHEQELAAERSRQAGALLEAQYESQRRQVEESTSLWQDGLSQVFADLGLDPRVGGQMADLGGQIVAGLFSDLEANQGGFFGLGQDIAKGFADVVNSLFGDSSSGGAGGAGSSWLRSLGSFFGGRTTAEAHAEGIQGPGLESGSFGDGMSPQGVIGAVQAGVQVAQGILSASERDRGAKDNRAWGGAAGSGIGALIAGIPTGGLGAPLGAAIGEVIGSTIGRLFGRGASNPDTQARHVFANWLEEKLAEVGGTPVYAGGRFSRLTNFVEGASNRFNRPGWADEFNKNPGSSVFSGVGEGLRRLSGADRDIGGQIAALLFENMAGDVDNLRMAVKRLGLSFEDIEKIMVEAGNAGEKTWLEVETALVGASEAFKDGLAAVGDFNKAMQMLLDSGAKGFEAVQSVRNIAIEAREAGIQNFTQLREHLLKTFDPSVVDAFFASLAQRNITTLEQLSGLSDRQAGQVVADMQAAGVQFKTTGEDITATTEAATAKVDEAARAVRELTAAVRDLDLTPEPEPDPLEGEPEVALANGGVLTRPTRALMGEAGPEAVLPLTRKGGRLGVALHGAVGTGGGAMVLNIDARGAAPGVEHEINRAIRAAEERIVRRVYESANHGRGRAL